MTDAVLPAWRGRDLWTIAALGSAQTIAWASSYYLPAILAAPIARDLSISPTFVYGALSAGLVISGLLGPRVGHFIDTFGGRGLLAVSNLVLAAGLVLLSFASGSVVLIASWVILGVGMGMGLYEAAFATLTRIYGYAARKPITGITLIAGFASTVGWPITAYLDAQYGWRVACEVWALIHLAFALPLNLSLPRAEPLKAHVDEEDSSVRASAAKRDRRHGYRGLCLCSNRVCEFGSFRLDAVSARSVRRDTCGSVAGRNPDRAGAGDGADHRSGMAEPLPSSCVDAAGDCR